MSFFLYLYFEEIILIQDRECLEEEDGTSHSSTWLFLARCGANPDLFLACPIHEEPGLAATSRHGRVKFFLAMVPVMWPIVTMK